MLIGEDSPLREIEVVVERQAIVPISKCECSLRTAAIILDAVALICFAMAADYNTQTQSLGISSTALWVAGGVSGALGGALTGRWMAKDCCKDCRR